MLHKERIVFKLPVCSAVVDVGSRVVTFNADLKMTDCPVVFFHCHRHVLRCKTYCVVQNILHTYMIRYNEDLVIGA